MSKYVFKPYSEIFPTLFLQEKKRISSYVQENALIEHVGSSAVPGLGGKGIIDIAIGSEKRSYVLSKLQELGYEFRPDYSTETRFFLKRKLPDSEEGIRTYHIHLMASQSEEWKDMIFFKDYLKSHLEEAKKYAEIKEKASLEAHEHGDLYRRLKEPFMKEILLKRFDVL